LGLGRMWSHLKQHGIQVSLINLTSTWSEMINTTTFHSHYWPYARSQVWYNKPDILLHLSPPNLAYLPTNTVKIKLPWVFAKTDCPVTAQTTAAWTEKERLKTENAPIMETIEDLKKYVSSSSDTSVDRCYMNLFRWSLQHNIYEGLMSSLTLPA
jgi:hypothetical protein